jgi:hypothetical protein
LPESNRRYAGLCRLSGAALLPALMALIGCALSGGGKVVAPVDLPDICQDLDFNRDVEFRELCGVKTRDYLAYRNIPEHRNLLQPKGGKIIKKGKRLELRLQNTLPAELPEELTGKIIFDENLRRTFIKSRMDYCEFFPENSNHNVKIILLDIPHDMGGQITVCYTVESRPTTAQRKVGYASRLEALDCGDFRKLKARSLEMAEPAAEADSASTPGASQPPEPEEPGQAP